MSDIYTYGSVVSFTATFRDAYDELVDPSPGTAVLTITTPTNISTSYTLNRVSLGQYTYQYTIPPSYPTGTSLYYYSGTIDGETTTSNLESFTVQADTPITPNPNFTHYCSVSDIRQLLPELNPTDWPDSQIAIIIEEVATCIDDCLNSLYLVPFSPVPPSISHYCKRLTAAAITDFTHRGDGTAEEVPFSIRLRSSVNNALKAYACGQLTITGAVMTNRVKSSSWALRTSDADLPIQNFDFKYPYRNLQPEYNSPNRIYPDSGN